MTLEILIEEKGKARRVEADEFPLTLGGQQADIDLQDLDTVEPIA